MSSRSSSMSDPLTPALLAKLRAQLERGEHLTWAASPEPLAFERRTRGIGKRDAAVILGGGYAVIGACVMALRTAQWLWLGVPLALFAIGGVGYAIARWTKARARSARAGTVYGLTTRRALIVHTYPALAVRALAIGAITDVAVRDERGPFADLCLRNASATSELVFQGLPEAERARSELLRVIRDPQAAEREIAAAEAYSSMMHQLAARSTAH